MRTASIPLGSQIPRCVHRPEILTAIRLDNYGRPRSRGDLAFPPKELLPITAKCYFNKMHIRQRPSRIIVVIPAKAGIHLQPCTIATLIPKDNMDSRFRGNDGARVRIPRLSRE